MVIQSECGSSGHGGHGASKLRPVRFLAENANVQRQEVNSKLAQAEDRLKARAQIATTDGLKTRQQIDKQSKV